MRSGTPALLCLLACPLAAGPARSKEKPPLVYKIPSPAKPNFSALAWLLGEWSGKIGSKEPLGEVHFSASCDLENRFMILREELWLQNTKNAPASRESWMGVLSPRPDGKSWFLRVYSNYGFITTYQVTADGAGIHFNFVGGEDPPEGWLFRRVIARMSETEFTETVQVAPPDRPFFDYYSAKLTRGTASPPLPVTSSANKH